MRCQGRDSRRGAERDELRHAEGTNGLRRRELTTGDDRRQQPQDRTFRTAVEQQRDRAAADTRESLQQRDLVLVQRMRRGDHHEARLGETSSGKRALPGVRDRDRRRQARAALQGKARIPLDRPPDECARPRRFWLVDQHRNRFGANDGPDVGHVVDRRRFPVDHADRNPQPARARGERDPRHVNGRVFSSAAGWRPLVFGGSNDDVLVDHVDPRRAGHSHAAKVDANTCGGRQTRGQRPHRSSRSRRSVRVAPRPTRRRGPSPRPGSRSAPARPRSARTRHRPGRLRREHRRRAAP